VFCAVGRNFESPGERLGKIGSLRNFMVVCGFNTPTDGTVNEKLDKPVTHVTRLWVQAGADIVSRCECSGVEAWINIGVGRSSWDFSFRPGPLGRGTIF